MAQAQAIRAEAYRQLGYGEKALSAARAGLAALLPTPRSAGQLTARLQSIHALLLDETGQPGALATIDAALAQHATDPRAVACLRRERGWIRYSYGNIEGALTDNIAAYTLLTRDGPRSEAMVTAGRLAAIYGAAGEYESAAALLTETIDYFGRTSAGVRLATAHSRLGDLEMLQKRYVAALAQFAIVRGIGVESGDPWSVAFADMRGCQVHIEQGALEVATHLCDKADSAFTAAQLWDGPTRHHMTALRGRLALGRHDHAGAIALFTAALNGGEDMLPSDTRARIYKLRGSAYAALGQYATAYADQQQYDKRLLAWTDAQTANRIAAMRIRFGMDREQRKNQLLQRERADLLASAARDRVRRNAIGFGAALLIASVLLIAFAFQRRRTAEAARLEAERRTEELGRLTSGIAHDFNNLMTVVLQAVGMLAKQPAVRSDVATLELVEAAHRAAEAGGDITQQLLAFGRQQQLRPEDIALQSFFERYNLLLQRAAGSKASVLIETISQDVRVRVDPRQLLRALLNLLSNARDSIDSSGVIRVHFQQASDSGPNVGLAPLSVSDTGRGMNAAVLARATEPFFTTKDAVAGSGLGLSAVDGFTRQSGGKLEITSEPGRGTAITMWLPSSAHSTSPLVVAAAPPAPS